MFQNVNKNIEKTDFLLMHVHPQAMLIVPIKIDKFRDITTTPSFVESLIMFDNYYYLENLPTRFLNYMDA